MTFTVRRLREDRPRRRFPWKTALVLLQVGRPVAEWVLRLWHTRKEEADARERRVRWLRRIFAVSTVGLCATLLLAGTASALIKLKILSLRTVVSVTSTPLPRDGYGHFNILLLGQGDATHDGADLTDTIMVASLDPDRSKSTVLLSIPRDLYVNTKKMGSGRINSLYRDYKYWMIGKGVEREEASQEAMNELAREVGSLLNVDIHRVLKVDFIGFVQAVDAIGGVEIDVPYDIVDREYPGANYGYDTFAISQGVQTLDGETALKYARSRHTTSDFSRSARQQQILRGLGQKVREEGVLSNPGRMLSLLKILQDHVESTMSVREIAGLGDMGSRLDHDAVVSVQLTNDATAPGGFLYNPPRDQFAGASVLLPYSWNQLRTLGHLMLNVRTPYTSRSAIRIVNAGAQSGSARRLAYELIRYGFDVVATENADERDVEKSYIETAEADRETARFFGSALGLPVIALEAETTTGSRLPLNLNLGDDYVFSDLATLLDLPEDPEFPGPPSAPGPAVNAGSSASVASTASDADAALSEGSSVSAAASSASAAADEEDTASSRSRRTRSRASSASEDDAS